MEPTDEALVQACRAGNATAWEALVDRYQRLVYAIARHSGLDAEQSADVFQRVFELLVESLPRIERPALIGAWLATTARHESWRVSRGERMVYRMQGEPLESARAVADDAPLPEALLLRLEQQHLVRLAVDSLDERCRRLLQLLFYRADAPPYAEIAARLGMAEGAIGPTRARCLQKLRRRLEEER